MNNSDSISRQFLIKHSNAIVIITLKPIFNEITENSFKLIEEIIPTNSNEPIRYSTLLPANDLSLMKWKITIQYWYENFFLKESTISSKTYTKVWNDVDFESIAEDLGYILDEY